MSYLFNLIYGLALFLMLPWLVFRAITAGRYRRGLGQKLFGTRSPAASSSVAKPQAAVIWFHGVSVGEIHLLTTVVKAFRKRHPDWQCVISTTTDTGMAEATKRFSDLPVIYYPFDFSWAVNRTLKTLQPKLIVLAESELWPNFLRCAAKRQVPVMVINGRMSPRSAGRFRKLAWLARPLMFSRVRKFVMQTEGYAQALRDLGVATEKVAVTGSVKYDGVLGERNNPQTRNLAEQLGLVESDRVWVAGSTHAPEEAIILGVFRKLRSKHPALRLILVPRSPDRFDEVADLIERSGYSLVRRSQINPAACGLANAKPQAAAVILIDTMGELNAAWGLAQIGFTGGSLENRRGGQSMIEPAGLGVPVVFGPSVWNFRDAARRLIEADGAIQIASINEMEQALQLLLNDDELRRTMGRAAREMVLAQQGATERTLDEIDTVLGPNLGLTANIAA